MFHIDADTKRGGSMKIYPPNINSNRTIFNWADFVFASIRECSLFNVQLMKLCFFLVIILASIDCSLRHIVTPSFVATKWNRYCQAAKIKSPTQKKTNQFGFFNGFFPSISYSVSMSLCNLLLSNWLLTSTAKLHQSVVILIGIYR